MKTVKDMLMSNRVTSRQPKTKAKKQYRTKLGIPAPPDQMRISITGNPLWLESHRSFELDPDNWTQRHKSDKKRVDQRVQNSPSLELPKVPRQCTEEGPQGLD